MSPLLRHQRGEQSRPHLRGLNCYDHADRLTSTTVTTAPTGANPVTAGLESTDLAYAEYVGWCNFRDLDWRCLAFRRVFLAKGRR